MVDVVVLMAFRGDGEGFGGTGWRDRAYTVVRPHVEDVWPVFAADSGDEPFNVGRSYNLAAEMAGEWDVAILHPPDEWVPTSQLAAAVEQVGEGQVYAFHRMLNLNRAGTQVFYRGHRGAFRNNLVKRRLPKRGHRMPDWSGPRAVSRTLWDRFGGFDEYLTGWGAEDEIFAHCCAVFGAPASRVEGRMIDLWHPRHDGSEFYAHRQANGDRWRYLRSVTDPAQLLEALRDPLM